jgi:predicted RNA-binding Zn-ribbon protein involved in translation (DUF1610 family)
MMVIAVVRVQCSTELLFFSKALLVAWASVVVFFSQGFIDYGDWEAHVAGGALTLLFSSIAVMLIIGGRPACGNCGERVLDDKGVSQASPVAYVKPFASVSMRALFAGNFLCPHCGARNLVRRS